MGEHVGCQNVTLSPIHILLKTGYLIGYTDPEKRVKSPPCCELKRGWTSPDNGPRLPISWYVVGLKGAAALEPSMLVSPLIRQRYGTTMPV